MPGLGSSLQQLYKHSWSMSENRCDLGALYRLRPSFEFGATWMRSSALHFDSSAKNCWLKLWKNCPILYDFMRFLVRYGFRVEDGLFQLQGGMLCSICMGQNQTLPKWAVAHSQMQQSILIVCGCLWVPEFWSILIYAAGSVSWQVDALISSETHGHESTSFVWRCTLWEVI